MERARRGGLRHSGCAVHVRVPCGRRGRPKPNSAAQRASRRSPTSSSRSRVGAERRSRLHRLVELARCSTGSISRDAARVALVRAGCSSPSRGWGRSVRDRRQVVDAHPGQTFPARVTEISPNAEFAPKAVETRAERVNRCMPRRSTSTAGGRSCSYRASPRKSSSRLPHPVEARGERDDRVHRSHDAFRRGPRRSADSRSRSSAARCSR